MLLEQQRGPTLMLNERIHSEEIVQVGRFVKTHLQAAYDEHHLLAAPARRGQTARPEPLAPGALHVLQEAAVVHDPQSVRVLQVDSDPNVVRFLHGDSPCSVATR